MQDVAQVNVSCESTMVSDQEGMILLPQTAFLRGLHTEMRDALVSRERFRKCAKQVIRLLMEASLNVLPYQAKVVTTPVGEKYQGLSRSSLICGVSIIRAGESMEEVLLDYCPDVPIGKILIQRNRQTLLPKLYYSSFPKDLKDRFIFLMEPMLATGGSAVTAIELLLSLGVREDRIILVNLLTVREGIHAIMSRFPDVRIVTSSIERELSDRGYMIPGIGDFGDRYFGADLIHLAN